MKKISDEMILELNKVNSNTAADYLGIPVRNLHEGLQEGKYPFGIAYKKKEWVYIILPERLVQYKHGYDMVPSVAIH